MKEIETYFRYLKTIGVEFVELPSGGGTTASNAAATVSLAAARPAVARPLAETAPKALPAVRIDTAPAGGDTLEKIAAEVAACAACGLCRTRTQTVFADGDPNATMMFVGEAPGADEDAQGKPFVGRAGQLLTKMIEAIDFRREEVYIANVLKCRPPGNRDPLPAEVASCEGFLKRQIALVKPLIICALGAHAAHTLLLNETPIGRLRGRIYQYEGVPLVVTYHPAFLLRSPQYKKEAWKDLQMLRDEHARLLKEKGKA